MQKGNHVAGGRRLTLAVLTVAVPSILGAEILRVVSIKHQNALQTATWQGALLAAESGIDLAVVELRNITYGAPNHAWEGSMTLPGGWRNELWPNDRSQLRPGWHSPRSKRMWTRPPP